MGGLSSSKSSFAGYRIKAGASRALLLIALGIGIASNNKAQGMVDFDATTIDNQSPVLCPPCDMIFSKLLPNAAGERVQNVKVQERGEPKSGTSFSMEWAAETLYHVCDYLDGLFGNSSCEISLDIKNSLRHTRLTFDPDSGDTENAICRCEDVER